jgi:hypothetical protein
VPWLRSTTVRDDTVSVRFGTLMMIPMLSSEMVEARLPVFNESTHEQAS